MKKDIQLNAVKQIIVLQEGCGYERVCDNFIALIKIVKIYIHLLIQLTLDHLGCYTESNFTDFLSSQTTFIRYQDSYVIFCRFYHRNYRCITRTGVQPAPRENQGLCLTIRCIRFIIFRKLYIFPYDSLSMHYICLQQIFASYKILKDIIRAQIEEYHRHCIDISLQCLIVFNMKIHN